MRIRLEDLPDRVRRQVEEKLRSEGTTRNGVSSCPVPEATSTAPARRCPNKTETEYNKIHLGGTGRYEALTLRLPGGSRYTPDFMTLSDQGVTLHEVKGSYRLGSHGRALTAFREAVAAFPCFGFVWATRKQGGGWDVKRYGGTNNA